MRSPILTTTWGVVTRNIQGGQTPSPLPGKRKRSSVECVRCRERKVRCIQPPNDAPCANDIRDRWPCDVVDVKKRRAFESLQDGNDTNLNCSHPRPSSLSTQLQAAALSSPAASGELGYSSFTRRANIFQKVSSSGEDQIPTAHNDEQHIQAAIQSHFGRKSDLDGKISDTGLQPEDFQYLQLKGVFSLPPEAVCDKLVRSYFYHVHSLFPIFDANKFLNSYSEGETRKLNLLLMWSMFCVASSVRSFKVNSGTGLNHKSSSTVIPSIFHYILPDIKRDRLCTSVQRYIKLD